MSLSWSQIVAMEQEGRLPQVGAGESPKYEDDFIEDHEVVICDKHGRNIDQPAWSAFLMWLEENGHRLSMITDNGDWTEQKEISRWAKPADPDQLREDLSAARQQDDDVLARFDGPFHKTLGNHDIRWEVYAQGAPKITGIAFKTIPEVMDFEGKGITLHEGLEGFVHRGVRRTHGESVRKEPGQSARHELENWMQSGVSGHVHRLAVYQKHHLWWAEGGCFQDFSTSHFRHTPHWTHGFVVLHHLASGECVPELIRIVNGRVVRF